MLLKCALDGVAVGLSSSAMVMFCYVTLLQMIVGAVCCDDLK